MSNFLQRIASTVGAAQARPRLQPMLGSIFAPVAGVAADPPGAWESHSETVARRPEVESYSERADRPVASALARELHAEDAAPAPSFALREEPPLLPKNNRGEEPAPRRMNRAEQGVGALSRRQVAESAKAESAKAQSAKEEASLSSAASQTPSADSSPSSSPIPIRPAQTMMLIPLQSLRAAAAPRVEQPRRAPAQRSEPDEIHIHIGRIEVASVAPPRVPAPPPRKSLSLDDYLRGSHGGQR